MYCTKCGKEVIDSQGDFCAFCGNKLVASTISSEKPKIENVYENVKTRPAGFAWAAGLFYVHSALWSVVCIIQWFSVLTQMPGNSPLLTVWNSLFTILCFFIANAISKQKAWGYSWGVGTSFLNILSLALQLFSQMVNPYFAVVLILDITTFILLRVNKQSFIPQSSKKPAHFSLRMTQADMDNETNEKTEDVP